MNGLVRKIKLKVTLILALVLGLVIEVFSSIRCRKAHFLLLGTDDKKAINSSTPTQNTFWGFLETIAYVARQNHRTVWIALLCLKTSRPRTLLSTEC